MVADRTANQGNRIVQPDIRVAFVLSPSFTLLPFAGFADTLRHSADDADRSRQIYCHWRILGPSLTPIRSSCGAKVSPWQTYDEPTNYDYVVIVGGLLSAFEQHAAETFDFLRAAAGRQVPVVGLCTGSFAMAEAGLLDGKRCSIHFRHREEFEARYPNVTITTQEYYTFDDGMITCCGGTAAIDLAVEIITLHCGRARALKGLADLIVEEHREVHHVPRFPYEELLSCGDWRIERAVMLMRSGLSNPSSTRDLAKRIGTSVSQLDRAFVEHVAMTPTQVWRAMRLQHARWRLLNTDRSTTEIAEECGFADCAHLVRWFKREYGETPQRFRRKRLDVTLGSIMPTGSRARSRVAGQLPAQGPPAGGSRRSGGTGEATRQAGDGAVAAEVHSRCTLQINR